TQQRKVRLVRIAISGIDGSGKTTLCGVLTKWLRNLNFPVYLQNLEPRAYQARELTQIIDSDDDRLSSIFFNSAKKLDGDPGFARTRFSKAYVEYIMALEEVKLFERFAVAFDTDSSFVIHDRHVIDRKINALLAGCPADDIKFILGLIRSPDLTFLLDLPVNVSQERLLKTRGHLGADEVPEEQVPLRQAYLETIVDDLSVCLLEASQPANAVFERAKLEILERFSVVGQKARRGSIWTN
ncbi:MAG TPA: hypothetical protein VGT44_01320, partial [Ktedonobacteraceae bacterium]|nr:hypothetical protein [Ktedonobacteraceae bacterium]